MDKPVFYTSGTPIGRNQLNEGYEAVGSVLFPQWTANKQNLKLAEYQYSKELEMWNRQNEYNTPLAQMERYMAAGLNPNLTFSQGNSGNATQMPRYQAPTISYDQKIPMVLNTLQTFADLDIKQATSDKIREETQAVRDTNVLTNIQKQYWAQNEFNKAQKLYNDGKISARTFDRIQREFELLFNANMSIKDDGSYIWNFGETSVYQIRAENEILRHNIDMALADQKKQQNEKFLKYFDSNMVMRLLGNFVGLFK